MTDTSTATSIHLASALKCDVLNRAEIIKMHDDKHSGLLLREFTVRGLLGQNNYKMEVKPPATIIVGPNGTGKSNFLSIFYLVITKQWAKLSDFDFDEVILASEFGELSIKRSDLFDLTTILSESSRTRDSYETLTSINKQVHLYQPISVIHLKGVIMRKSSGHPHFPWRTYSASFMKHFIAIIFMLQRGSSSTISILVLSSTCQPIEE